MSKVAAEGRPIAGLDSEDRVFSSFMVLEDEHPRLARLLMRWAQRHHLTHQREFEEASPELEKPTIGSEHEAEALDLDEMTLHQDYWVCQWALYTLWSWRFLPTGGKMIKADPPNWAPVVLEPPAAKFENRVFCVRPGWDVLNETDPMFRARVREALTGYIKDARRLAEAQGLAEPSEKRQGIHFDWFALYQVKGWSWDQIADWDVQHSRKNAKGVDLIRKGVQNVAKLVKLSPRPNRPPGRPKSGNRKFPPRS